MEEQSEEGCGRRATRLSSGSAASPLPDLRTSCSTWLSHMVPHVVNVPGHPQTQEKRSTGYAVLWWWGSPMFPVPLRIKLGASLWSTQCSMNWLPPGLPSPRPHTLTDLLYFYLRTFAFAVPLDLSPGSLHLLYPHDPVPTLSSEIN